MFRGDRARAERAGGLTRAALRHRPIRLLVAAFAAVTLGEWVLGTTVAIHAYGAGGVLAVGLVGFRFAPAALTGLWATRLAERAHRQRVLVLTAAARAAAMGAAALALALGAPLPVVIGLVWIDASIGSAYRPTQAALLPALVRTPSELTAAAALASNVKSSGQIIGALLGSLLVSTLPVSIAVAVAAGLALAAAALNLREGAMGAVGGVASTRAGNAALRSLRSGAELLSRDREARLVVMYACLRSLVRGLWIALAVVASLRLLSLGRSGFGVLLAAAGVGALAAIVATALLIGNRRLSRWFATGLLLCGLPVAATGSAHGPAPAIAFMVIWGMGMSLADVGAQTLLNRIVPSTAIGPVTGVMESGKLVFEGVGSMFAPVLLLIFGVRGALFVAGALLPVAVGLAGRGFRRIDDRAVARVDTLELLRRVPFFDPLRVDALEGVAARLRLERHPAGRVIVRQGDVDADRWYLVSEGQLIVEVDGFAVGVLRRGTQFGERALLRGVSRAATVRAETEVQLYSLDRADFLAAVAGGELDAGAEVAIAAAYGPQPVDAATALARAPLVQTLGPAARARLFAQSYVEDLAAGTPIVRSGEHDDTYHVLLSGRAEVFAGGELRRELLPGDAFGEIAVLQRVPRTASVIVSDPARVLTLDGEAIRAALREQGGTIAALMAS
jgi:CRP-like cAMP-binding protein